MKLPSNVYQLNILDLNIVLKLQLPNPHFNIFLCSISTSERQISTMIQMKNVMRNPCRH